jgi:ribosome maturation factor RimP
LFKHKKQQKGTATVPFFFYQMNNDTQIQMITQMLEPLLQGDPGYFLVDIKIASGNQIKIFIDGDAGVTIEKCVFINRALYRQIEENGLFPGGDFALEVSSPGLDEPLKLHRQYTKNIGRHVEVVLNDNTRVEGKMIAAGSEEIVVEETRGKKKEIKTHSLPYQNIKTTKIQVVF